MQGAYLLIVFVWLCHGQTHPPSYPPIVWRSAWLDGNDKWWQLWARSQQWDDDNGKKDVNAVGMAIVLQLVVEAAVILRWGAFPKIFLVRLWEMAPGWWSQGLLCIFINSHLEEKWCHSVEQWFCSVEQAIKGYFGIIKGFYIRVLQSCVTVTYVLQLMSQFALNRVWLTHVLRKCHNSHSCTDARSSACSSWMRDVPGRCHTPS